MPETKLLNVFSINNPKYKNNLKGKQVFFFLSNVFIE